MLNVVRIANACFTTTRLTSQLEYYTEVLGLTLIGREDGRAFLATRNGQVAVILEAGDKAQCTGIGFEVARGFSMAEMQSALASTGIIARRRTDVGPGLAEALVFDDPKGTEVAIYQNLTPVIKVRSALLGISPLKLGHIAFKGHDVPALVEFYRQVMGFRVSDWRGNFFVFMRCGPDHHTINFIAGEHPRLHHIAFELKDGAAMLQACDHLGLSEHPIIWGPGRHLIGGNMFTYHRDNDGHIIELYTDLAQMKSEALGHFEAQPWHSDAVYEPKDWPAGVSSNLWGPPSPPGFRD